ncbi:MAG: hypothetical protein M0C28_13360 [Candidatus Moduliflexus flocculans]|nr:hypothetical protein [Candidatus Moduliflexus flocculans]
MELYHNQVTREQGPFSLRMFHRSWGIIIDPAQHLRALRGARLPHPRARSIEELRGRTSYDVVGISSHHRERRQGARDVPASCASSPPHATIVVGGHVTAIPGVEQHDRRRPHRAGRRRRRGCARYLGEDADAPITHPRSSPVVRARASWACTLPQAQRQHGRHDHPVGGLPDGLQLLHDLGVLRRQGQGHQLLRDGRRALRRDVRAPRRELGVKSFFVMDENFLLYKRARDGAARAA